MVRENGTHAGNKCHFLSVAPLNVLILLGPLTQNSYRPSPTVSFAHTPPEWENPTGTAQTGREPGDVPNLIRGRSARCEPDHDQIFRPSVKCETKTVPNAKDLRIPYSHCCVQRQCRQKNCC
jgi:hypothetical protein